VTEILNNSRQKGGEEEKTVERREEMSDVNRREER